MADHIEDFDVICSDNGVRGIPEDISVFGTPFHESSEELIEDYINSTGEEFFKDEQLNSCGNYLLASQESPETVRVITSPGYAGGYMYDDSSFVRLSTTFVNAIESWMERKGTIEDEYLKYFINEGLSTYPPVGTPFKNIIRLSPGTEVLIEAGEIKNRRSYLRPREVSMTVPEALTSCAASLADENVTVMFSGGIDSTCWYLALRKELSDNQIELVTVDWRPGASSQGPYYAKPVAERLGVDLDVVAYDDGWLTDNSHVVDHLTNCMRQDLTKPFAPHHALANKETNNLLIHGQNMDSIIALKMNRFQHSFTNYLKGISNINKAKYGFNYIINQYLNNIPYTSRYIRNKKFRMVYIMFILPILRTAEFVEPNVINSNIARCNLNDIDFSEESILTSLIRRNTNNVQDTSHAKLLQREIDEFDHLSEVDDFFYHCRLLYFYSYMAMANKMIAKLPIGNSQRRCHLPSNWGPMVTTGLSNELTLKDAYRPKHQLDTFLQNETDMTYDELRFHRNDPHDTEDRIPRDDYLSEVYSSIIPEHKNLLSSDGSIMRSFLNDEIEEWYRNELKKIGTVRKTGTGDNATVGKAHRLLNLELLLQNADA